MLDINKAESFVKNNNIANQISTSQIRKFLAAVNKINNKIRYQNNDDILSEDIVAEIAYMRVQFAYIVGKNKSSNYKNKDNEGLEKLHKELDDAIANIKDSKSNFINFARYVEAIVAYHKFHGGRDENVRR